MLALAACSRRDPIAACDDDLHGVYASGDERWMVIDHGEALEAYPVFPDGAGPEPDRSLPGRSAARSERAAPGASSAPADVVVAPRVIDLQRAPAAAIHGSTDPGAQRGAARTPPAEPAALTGTLRRRYMRRAEGCDAHVPVHVTRCAGDTIELVLADPAPPIAFSPCTWPGPGPSRLVRWRRE